jgi:hypothetical protein
MAEVTAAGGIYSTPDQTAKVRRAQSARWNTDAFGLASNE